MYIMHACALNWHVHAPVHVQAVCDCQEGSTTAKDLCLAHVLTILWVKSAPDQSSWLLHD